ncbi:MAG: hypothetical protein EOM12_05725 [Verrucomicrobiae bacterium]|nr:hypothetical protein [Verrucomicrobiae bacterium]
MTSIIDLQKIYILPRTAWLDMPPATGRQSPCRPVALGDYALLLFMFVGMLCCAGVGTYLLIGVIGWLMQ